jgi:hypothetical protein
LWDVDAEEQRQADRKIGVRGHVSPNNDYSCEQPERYVGTRELCRVAGYWSVCGGEHSDDHRLFCEPACDQSACSAWRPGLGWPDAPYLFEERRRSQHRPADELREEAQEQRGFAEGSCRDLVVSDVVQVSDRLDDDEGDTERCKPMPSERVAEQPCRVLDPDEPDDEGTGCCCCQCPVPGSRPAATDVGDGYSCEQYASEGVVEP